MLRDDHVKDATKICQAGREKNIINEKERNAKHRSGRDRFLEWYGRRNYGCRSKVGGETRRDWLARARINKGI